MSARRDATVIGATGVVVSAAPALWYSLLWPGQPGATEPLEWLFVFGLSIVPFIQIAGLRGSSVVGRLTAAVTLAAVGALAVLLQYAGLNPNDPSSTAVVALVFIPFYGCLIVTVAFAGESVVRAATRRLRERRAG